MNYKSIYTAAGLALALSASAHAQTFTPLITQTVGTGSEESFFTLDFQDGTADHSYAFGYLYNGIKTGADLLSALSAGTSLQIGYDPGYTPTSGNPAGVFVNSFSFNGHSAASPGNSYWAYFTGPDGQNWNYSDSGASVRQLSNGSWDGWSWDSDYTNAVTPAPVTPNAAPIPEASSVLSFGLLLILGLGVTMAQLRRKSAA